MGYTISTSAKSAELADRMHVFLKTHALYWELIVKAAGLPERFAFESASPNSPEGFLLGVWREGKTTIELSYSTISGWDRVYLFTLIRWVAIRIGRERRKFQQDFGRVQALRLKESAPYWVYDGQTDDATPILVCPNWTDAQRWGRRYRPFTTDEYGVRLGLKNETYVAAAKDHWIMWPEDRPPSPEIQKYMSVRAPENMTKAEYKAYYRERDQEGALLFADDIRAAVKALREYLITLDEDWKAFNK